MELSHIRTIEDIEKILNTSEHFTLLAKNKKEIYESISTILEQTRYHRLKKKQKGIVRQFLLRITQYSNIQLKRLISKHREGKLHWKPWQYNGVRSYDDKDITLLHQTDSFHECSGATIKKILQREYSTYGKEEYRKLANISVSHIYNLRKSRTYQRLGRTFEKTQSRNIPIGKRQKPQPNGKPGYFRIDCDIL